MSAKAPEPPAEAGTVAADLLDERLIQSAGLGGAARAFTRRIRGGDLGSLPVVVGLVIIWAVFGIVNPRFLSSINLVNLSMQCAAVGTIAIGVVLVLLLAEIDLSIGSVSGLAAAIVAVGYVGHAWPLWTAVLAAIAAGALIGLFYALLNTRFGVPSFVITLAGLLGILGAQLWVLGKFGSINLPFDSWLVYYAQQLYMPDWLAYVFVAVAVLGYWLAGFLASNKRKAAGLSGVSASALGLRAAGLLVLLGVPVWYLNRSRGVGVMFLTFVALVLIMHFFLSRTRWGRAVFAVGGNVEAARRAGINVRAVAMSVFILCSTFAALGGLMAAGRLSAANQSSGGGDINLNAIAAAVIGGTSLFGGRGSAFSALLGILVIQSISSGLTLVNLDSSLRYMITGAVLLLAVVIDSLSRRSRRAAGRA